MSQPVDPRYVCFVDRNPPPVEPHPFLDQIKRIAGVAMVFLGLTILTSSSVALAGYVLGKIAISLKSLQSFFIMGIACSVGGFHLIKGGYATPSLDINAGWLSVTT